jgi:hypothetical protein
MIGLFGGLDFKTLEKVHVYKTTQGVFAHSLVPFSERLFTLDFEGEVRGKRIVGFVPQANFDVTPTCYIPNYWYREISAHEDVGCLSFYQCALLVYRSLLAKGVKSIGLVDLDDPLSKALLSLAQYVPMQVYIGYQDIDVETMNIDSVTVVDDVSKTEVDALLHFSQKKAVLSKTFTHIGVIPQFQNTLPSFGSKHILCIKWEPRDIDFILELIREQMIQPIMQFKRTYIWNFISYESGDMSNLPYTFAKAKAQTTA